MSQREWQKTGNRGSPPFDISRLIKQHSTKNLRELGQFHEIESDLLKAVVLTGFRHQDFKYLLTGERWHAGAETPGMSACQKSRFREPLLYLSSISQLSSPHPSGFHPAGIPVIGIVGGVGAGKSSVIRTVTSTRLFVIDADRVGHEQLTVAEIRDQLVNVFGSQILNAARQISRPELAAEVFGDSSDQKKKRQQLNEIVHPAIRKEMRRLIESAPQDVDAIILDAALLLEAGWADECDSVIFIDTPLRDRRNRVAETRGWSADEHARREASQWSLEKKREFSQFAVDNSGTPEESARQMEQVLKRILERSQSANVAQM